MSRCWFLFCLGLLVALPTGCDKPRPSTSELARNPKVYSVKGVVKAVRPAQKQVEIKHEEVPGFMPAMTMPFDVKDTNELAGIVPGQAVSFRLTVADMEAWIDRIQVLSSTATNAWLPGEFTPGPSATTRVARDVQPLSPGDALPEYVFTNQFGRAFHIADFKGKALALTFLFTRCPYPTFCPKMTAGFQDARQRLSSAPSGVTNWHLLTISFDPEFDTPSVLKSYAEAHQADPGHWTFATGDLIEITAIAEQFGLSFWRDPAGSINHNLRTAVIDPGGRVRRILEGNTWTGEELAAELRAAAGGGGGER